MMPSIWRFGSWKEFFSFQFRSIFDPWVFACWAVLVGVGVVAMKIHWNYFADSDTTLIYSRYAVPWLFSADLPNDLRGRIDHFIFMITFICIKLPQYGVLWSVSKKLRPEKKPLAAPSIAPFIILLLAASLLQIVPDLFQGKANCADSDSLSFSPNLTALGFSLDFIYSWVAAPVWEEMAFRGLMFNWLQHRSAAFRIIFIAILFAYMHVLSATGSLIPTVASLTGSFAKQILFAWFPAGLLLGYARQKTGSISIPIILHSALNVFVTIKAVTLLFWGVCLP